MGHEVTIFASSFNHYSRREERLAGMRLSRSEWIGPVRFVWVKTTPYDGNGLGRAVNMASYFVMVLLVQFRYSRPSSILGSSVHPLAGLAALVAARLRRARFYFEIRDLWPQTLIDLGSMRPNGVSARFLRLLERHLYRHARRVLTVLPWASAYIEGCGVPANRIVYIPNGAKLDTPKSCFPIGADAEKAREKLSAWRREGSLVAMYAGAHGEINRLDCVVRAAAVLESRQGSPRIRIALMGDGAEKPNLVGLVRRLGVKNLAFFEPVPKVDVQAVLEYVDVGIVSLADLPVFKYGLSPNKLMDYFCASKPVVLAAPAHDDPVTAAGAGMRIPSEDATALADALTVLAGMAPEERAALGRRGRDYMEKNHSLSELGRQLADFLELVS
jgi:glycosyltransferase involved in cell wall biosynthesis